MWQITQQKNTGYVMMSAMNKYTYIYIFFFGKLMNIYSYITYFHDILSVSQPINCAASSERIIAIFVCMFFGSFVLRTGVIY